MDFSWLGPASTRIILIVNEGLFYLACSIYIPPIDNLDNPREWFRCNSADAGLSSLT